MLVLPQRTVFEEARYKAPLARTAHLKDGGVVMTPTMTNEGRDVQTAKGASIIVLLAGIWFFISPWVYGAMGVGSAWNSWIVGVIMVIVAVLRIRNPLTAVGASWVNCVLGIWAFFSPWIYRYTLNHGRFVNSLVVGVIVFIASIVSANMLHRHPTTPNPTTPTAVTR